MTVIDRGRRGPKIKIRLVNKKRFSIFILIVLCVISILCNNIYILAKYIMEKRESTILEPAKFYFDSNYLTTASSNYNIYDWSDGIKVELYNHKDGNTSKIDVGYTVSVTNGTSDVNSGTIATNEIKDTLTITPTNVEVPVTVSVTTTPYNIPMSATFNLIEIGTSANYTFTDKGNYCELVIKTGQDTITPTINWDDTDYAPDNTNSFMTNWTGTSGTLSLAANSTYTFIFFENTSTTHVTITSVISSNTITLP